MSCTRAPDFSAQNAIGSPSSHAATMSMAAVMPKARGPQPSAYGVGGSSSAGTGNPCTIIEPLTPGSRRN